MQFSEQPVWRSSFIAKAYSSQKGCPACTRRMRHSALRYRNQTQPAAPAVLVLQILNASRRFAELTMSRLPKHLLIWMSFVSLSFGQVITPNSSNAKEPIFTFQEVMIPMRD